MTAIEFKINYTEESLGSSRTTYPFNSILESGEIHKIAVSGEGIHKMSYDFLKNNVGLDIDNIDPRKIGIYGGGGGMVPEANNLPRSEALTELAIYVKGQDDGQFNSGDYILFYAEGADKWYYDEATQ